AIIFGTRAISPFGLLGIVTRNRFKKLIHEQYPRIQEDIERGGMAAYVSEVAIDAGLMDMPPVKGANQLLPELSHRARGRGRRCYQYGPLAWAQQREPSAIAVRHRRIPGRSGQPFASFETQLCGV
ncbi:hypothetical protein FIBSPDRAFT_856313, partial [Athelia psychrophila]